MWQIVRDLLLEKVKIMLRSVCWKLRDEHGFFNEVSISILTTCAIAFKNAPKMVTLNVINGIFEHFPWVLRKNKCDFWNQRKILGLECTKPNPFYHDFCDFRFSGGLERL